MRVYRVILCSLILGVFPCLAVAEEQCNKAGVQEHQIPNFRVAAGCNAEEVKGVIIDSLIAQAEAERRTKCPACKCQYTQPSVCTTVLEDWSALDARIQVSPIRRKSCKNGVGWVARLTGNGSNDRFRSACTCVAPE
jgi:hypothetical protein